MDCSLPATTAVRKLDLSIGTACSVFPSPIHRAGLLCRGLLRRALLLGTMLVSFCLAVAARPACAQGLPPALTSEQRMQVKELLSEFRRHREEPERQGEAVGQLLEIGGPAVTQLMEAVEQVLAGRLKPYAGRFQRQAVELARGKLQGVNVQAVRQLQAQVLALGKQDNLTKEMITTQADPALDKLREVLVVDREAVLEASPQLREEREGLLAAGRHWERCLGHLIEQLPEDAETPREAPSFDDYLRGEEDLLTQLVAPMSPRARAILAANSRLATRVDREEARAILACNLTRNLLGLSPLTIDLTLTAVARDHSSDMQTHKFFSHNSPVPGKATPADRARNFGVSWSGENIFMGSTDGLAAHRAWFHSPGHHRNLLGNHGRVGVGRTGVYFTQMFGP